MSCAVCHACVCRVQCDAFFSKNKNRPPVQMARVQLFDFEDASLSPGKRSPASVPSFFLFTFFFFSFFPFVFSRLVFSAHISYVFMHVFTTGSPQFLPSQCSYRFEVCYRPSLRACALTGMLLFSSVRCWAVFFCWFLRHSPRQVPEGNLVPDM